MENSKREIEVELEEEVEVEEEIEVESDEEKEREENEEKEIEENEDNNNQEEKEENEEEEINSQNNIQENISSTNITSGEANYTNYDEINNFNFTENKQSEKEEELKKYSINIDNINDNNSEKKKKVRSAEEKHYIDELLNIIKNEEIIDLIDDKKWENRKNGFIKLNEFIIQNKINKKNFDIFFMYIYIKLNNFKETNFNLIKEGIQCILSLFSQINNNNYEDANFKISDKKYIKILLNDLYEKIADNKIKEIYLNLLEILNNNYSYKEILDILFDKLKNTKKVNILKEYAIFIKYLIEIKKILENNNENINIKNIIDFTINLSNNSNPQIRKISISIFCLLYKYIGKDLNLLIKNIKNESTIKIIEKEISKIKIEDNNPKSKNKFMIINNELKSNNINEPIHKINLKRIDISREIPIQLLNDIDKGKWNEKKEGIDFLHKLLDKSNNNILINGLDKLFLLIKNKLKDGNKNLVKIIIELLSHLIDALGQQIKKYCKNIIPSLLSNLSEKNQQFREECINCIQKWIICQNFEIFCNYFPKLLLNDNYEMRLSILDLLLKNCELITNQYNKTFLDEFLRSLLICLQDKNSIIRNKTEEFMRQFKLYKREDYIKESKEFKPVITEYLLSNIKAIFGDFISFQSFNSNTNNRPLINKSIDEDNIIKKSGKNNLLNSSMEIKTERKKKTKYPTINNNHNRYDSCPNVLNNENKKKNDIKKEIKSFNNIVSKNNKKQININLEINNKIKENKQENKNGFQKSIDKTPYKDNNMKDIYNNDLDKTLTNSEINKSCDNINKIKNKTNINNNESILETNKTKDSNLCKKNSAKNKRSNFIRLNLKNKEKSNNNNINFINKSVILSTNHISHNKNKGANSFHIFLPNYLYKDGEKQKRYEIDLKNNFLFEIQNFDYLQKLKELTKKIFSKEFNKKIFSLDIKDIIISINKLKNILELNEINNTDLQNLINNLDIILKILGYTLATKQSSSLIKIFFEFSELLINFNFNGQVTFNDIESNILLNIFCDKLLNNNIQLVNYSHNLINKLTEIIGDNKMFMMLMHLIRYKIIKLRYIIIDIIIKIFSDSKIDNNTLSKTLIIIINLWFESEFNIKNKIKPMIQKIYISLGKNEFISITKFLTDNQKNELFLKILEEDEDFFQENNINETEKKERIRSLSVCIRRTADKNEGIKPINILLNRKGENNKIYKKSSKISNLNKIDKGKKSKDNNIIKINNSISSKEFKKENKNIMMKDKKLFTLNNKSINQSNINVNTIENNHKEKVNRISYIKLKSQIIDNNKLNLKNVNKKINLTENSNSNSLSSEKLNSLLLSLYESVLKDNLKTKNQLINNIHDTIYHNFAKNKKIIIENSNNIIATFINTTKKYIEIISKEIIQLKNLTNSFYLICSIKEIISNISYDVEQNLLELVFNVVLYKDLNIMGKNKEGMSICKNYNSIMLRVIDYCNPSNTIQIILEQILINRLNKPKYIENYSKCLVLLTYSMKDICDKINVAKILFGINSFLLDYNKNPPKIQIQKVINNRLFITIKELVYEIVEIRKDKIIKDYYNYLNIKNKNNEDMVHDKNIKIWINEVIKTLDSNYLIK